MVTKKDFRFLRNVWNCLRHPIRYLSAFTSNPELKKNRIYCVMCGYNEIENVESAIQSIIGVADKLIFVDKNGIMKDQVLSFDGDIDIEYYVKPELNLLESRSFAIDRIPYWGWILVVDADEIVLVTRSFLKGLSDRKACYRTRMRVIHGAFEGTYAMNDFHPFFMYNDDGVYFAPPRDVPRYAGRNINLSTVCKENRAWCKDKRHLYYRATYWKGWQFSELKDKPIDDYILSVEGELPTDDFINSWYEWIISRGKQV